MLDLAWNIFNSASGHRCLIEGLRRACILWYELCTKLSVMELPVEAFCIFNNFFNSAFSHLMKIKNNVPGKKMLQSHLFSFTKLPFTKIKIIQKEGRNRDAAVAASGHLEATLTSTGLCWSSSRILNFIFHPFQSHCLLLQTGGACLLYLVASSPRL